MGSVQQWGTSLGRLWGVPDVPRCLPRDDEESGRPRAGVGGLEDDGRWGSGPRECRPAWGRGGQTGYSDGSRGTPCRVRGGSRGRGNSGVRRLDEQVAQREVLWSRRAHQGSWGETARWRLHLSRSVARIPRDPRGGGWRRREGCSSRQRAVPFDVRVPGMFTLRRPLRRDL